MSVNLRDRLFTNTGGVVQNATVQALLVTGGGTDAGTSSVVQATTATDVNGVWKFTALPDPGAGNWYDVKITNGNQVIYRYGNIQAAIQQILLTSAITVAGLLTASAGLAVTGTTALGATTATTLGTSGLVTAAAGLTSTWLAAGSELSGITGDVSAARAGGGAGTGFYFVGDGSHYFGYDGTSYQIPTSNTNVQSLTSAATIGAVGTVSAPVFANNGGVISTTGSIRQPNATFIGFRNHLNNGDIQIGVDGSDQLVLGGITTASTASTGSSGAAPGQVAGYLTINIGTVASPVQRKIAFYQP